MINTGIRAKNIYFKPMPDMEMLIEGIENILKSRCIHATRQSD